MFGIWVHNDELQIKFTFRSGPMIFGNKVVTTKYLAKFQSPRAITRPKIIGPERNVNLICNLCTHIPNIKSISQSIVKKKWWQLFISELRTWVTLYVPAFLAELWPLDFEILPNILLAPLYFTMIWDIDLILVWECIFISYRSTLKFFSVEWFLANLQPLGFEIWPNN
jgi:hypothetical protein